MTLSWSAGGRISLAGWQFVMVPDVTFGRMTYAEGFDRGQEYDFKRCYDNKIRRYRLSDQNDHFNITNLMFRPIDR